MPELPSPIHAANWEKQPSIDGGSISTKIRDRRARFFRRIYWPTPARGEITLLIAPEEHSAAGSQVATSQSIAARVEELMHQAKLDRKEALKVAAKERGLTRRAAYGQLVEEQDLEEKNKKD